MSRERKLRPLRADKVKEDDFAKMEEKSRIIVSESEDNDKFAATREYEKWESKLMTGVDHTFSSEVLATLSWACSLTFHIP